MKRKEKGFREPRRRGFDDENFSMRDAAESRSRGPSPRFASAPASAEGPPVGAVVKWFNVEKGFGFVELEDGSGDAFLHAAILESAGHQSVSPGAKLRAQVGQGAKGRQVTSVLEIDESATPAPAAARSERFPARSRPGRGAPDLSAAVELVGTVKWYNATKGFGFVGTEDNGRDVFVHASVLDKAGLSSLAEGERVSMRVVDTPKGREAVSIATLS